MSTAELQVAVERNVKHVADSIAEAWITLELLRALQSVARCGGAADQSRSRCADEFYRATFVALYARIGTIIDESGDVLSLPRLFKRLRSAWSIDSELLCLLGNVERELQQSETAAKVKAWRNKVVAHRTAKVLDEQFHEDNKVFLEELDALLGRLENWLNKLSVMATSEVYILRNTIPSLGDDVAVLFGVERPTRGLTIP